MGGMDTDELCARFGGVSSLTLSPISRESSDIPHATDVPVVGALCPSSQDSSSEVILAVGYARLPLPSVDNSVMPELVWVPALPQPTGLGCGSRSSGTSVAVGSGGPVSRGEVDVRWGLVVPSGTLHIVCRTMLNRWEITDFS